MRYLNDNIDIGTRLDRMTILIDDEDYERLRQFRWYDNGTVIHRYEYYYNCRKRYVSLAQEIMHQRVKYDHIDRNYLNNQKSNLRQATHQQNNFNKEKLSGCSSKYKGVSLERHSGLWTCRITFNRKLVFCKRFKTEIDAAKAYNEEAIKFFKEFTVLNDI